ncbi:MAG: sulfite exporter TauE/SafE family protein [Calditrichia bacterium]
MLSYLLIFLIAIASSTISAMVGLGGGLLLIPFILLIFDLPVKFVAGTMLFAMVPYTMVTTFKNLRNGFVNFKIGLLMEVGSITGAVLGANFTHILPETVLKGFLIAIVFYLMVTLRIPKDSPYNYVARAFLAVNKMPPHFLEKSTEKEISYTALVVFGLIAGIFSGMLGIGGGFLKTPVLIVGVGLASRVAVGTALFMIMITASFGAMTHGYLGDINFPIAISITLGMVLGGYLGSSLLKKQPDERVKKLVFYTMFVAAVMTLFR